MTLEDSAAMDSILARGYRAILRSASATTLPCNRATVVVLVIGAATFMLNGGPIFERIHGRGRAAAYR